MIENKLSVKKGEVWKVDLEPTQGTEIKKIRSCVVISTNRLNKWNTRFIVALLTSKRVDKVYAFEIPIYFQKRPGKAVCDQIRTVDITRMKKKEGELTKSEMDDIFEKLLAIFGLWEYLKENFSTGVLLES